ncbi:MAG: hypothetical protein JW760_14065 [Spirochaetales bacterium]|nr:hypothetical protein [Spirochaetales bacterium]
MNKRFYPLLLLLFLGIFPAAGNDETVSTRLHFTFIEAKGPRSPFVLDGHVIFTYQQDEPARYVAASFEHENFTVKHPFERYTPEGGKEVFLLAFPIPPAADTLVYRIIVDGLWMSDPANRDYILDVNGIPLSRYRIPPREVTKSYPVIEGSEVTFVFTGQRNQRITVAGTFNRWDPFMYPLEETSPGRYEKTLRLAPGDHVYHFIVNGAGYADPRNPEYRFDVDGNRFSLFTIPLEALPETAEAKKKGLRDRLPFLGGS